MSALGVTSALVRPSRSRFLSMFPSHAQSAKFPHGSRVWSHIVTSSRRKTDAHTPGPRVVACFLFFSHTLLSAPLGVRAAPPAELLCCVADLRSASLRRTWLYASTPLMHTAVPSHDIGVIGLPKYRIDSQISSARFSVLATDCARARERERERERRDGAGESAAGSKATPEA